MYRAKIQVKQNDKVKWEYLFSDTNKEKLFQTTINYFHGYIVAVGDFSETKLYTPCVMSLDGYHAWSKCHGLTIQLLNENDQIITTVNDII